MSAISRTEIWASTDALAWFVWSPVPAWVDKTEGWVRLVGFASELGIADGTYHRVTPPYLAYITLRVGRAIQSSSVDLESLGGAVSFAQGVVNAARAELGMTPGPESAGVEFERSGRGKLGMGSEWVEDWVGFPWSP